MVALLFYVGLLWEVNHYNLLPMLQYSKQINNAIFLVENFV